MSKPLDSIALFRLMVLGSLASRDKLQRGEVKKIVRELAKQTYHIPESRRVHLSEQTILRWYYDWKRGGIESLNKTARRDKGKTQLSVSVQSALLKLKQDNPARSINTLIEMLQKTGITAKKEIARATVHRFLKQHHASQRIIGDAHTIERRSFVADHAGDLWQGDVLHGPCIQTERGLKKTYLVSLMDDASRFIVHSAFCLGETALDIEGVLKQALLKRGLPRKLILDNGSAYRAGSLQTICAYLEIQLVYCRPYEPQGKGKLERFHRTFREQFIKEIAIDSIASLEELNARLWAWIEQVYHQRPHGGLEEQTPLERWRQDLIHVRPLTPHFANKMEDIFCHRFKRTVRKDGTISWDGKSFEVAHQYVGEIVQLVVDPHKNNPLKIESVSGDALGSVTPLNKARNLQRTRQRPHHALPAPIIKRNENAVELAYQAYNEHHSFILPSSKKEEQ